MDERRLILFFVLSAAIVFGWQWLVPTPVPPGPETTAEAPGTPPDPSAAPAPVDASPAPEAAVAPEAPDLPPVEAGERGVTVVETAVYRAEIDNLGAQLTTFRLHDYEDADGRPIDLVRPRQGGPWPLGLVDAGLAPHPLQEALFAVTSRVEGERTLIEAEYRGPLGAARKVLRFDAVGLVDIEVEVRGERGWGLVFGPGVRTPEPGDEGRFSGRQAVLRVAGDVEHFKAPKVGQVEAFPGPSVTWAGVEDTHFLAVFLPTRGLAEALVQPVLVAAGDEGTAPGLVPFEDEERLSDPEEDLGRDLRLVLRAAGEELAGEAYFGAKEYERLSDIGRDLQKTVEWGMFGIIARPLLLGLEWIHDNWVPNYGWGIVLMTLFLKILMFPLTHKSYISMQKMQKLQPRMQAIRQKYKGKLRDKKGRMDLEAQRKMNEEMQALFKSEGASPTGGCLPILLQMPVFFAFFRLLSTAVELRREPWMLWVTDLSRPDPMYLLPVLMGASQIYQQKLTPTAADPMQRRIMQLFPWMFTVFALSFPSGLVLYWTVNNVLTIVQTAAYKRWREGRDARDQPTGKKTGKGKRRKDANE